MSLLVASVRVVLSCVVRYVWLKLSATVTHGGGVGGLCACPYLSAVMPTLVLKFTIIVSVGVTFQSDII